MVWDTSSGLQIIQATLQASILRFFFILGFAVSACPIDRRKGDPVNTYVYTYLDIYIYLRIHTGFQGLGFGV